MFIAAVSAFNFKINSINKPKSINSDLGKENYFTNPVTTESSFLKSQSLFRLNKPSFKGGLRANLFKNVAAVETSSLWEKLIAREVELYKKPNELRSEFARDYDRILHSDGYNRLMGKTQVFSNPESDMTCTRIGHVNQVASIAENISEFFGLNTKLTRAIALGHDIGHSPFGHSGEVKLNAIMKANNLTSTFWKGPFFHEKNSLRFVDDIETKLNPNGYQQNLDLTYAVRDGIVCHCGEINENGLKPREEYIDLRTIQKTNRPQPFTWEGCVVKVSDKIAYLGKDLEDAINNGFLAPEKKNELIELVYKNTGLKFDEINNTVLINHFVSDLCANSTVEEGLKFSEPVFKLMNTIKDFNYKNIYYPKDEIQDPRNDLALELIFKNLSMLYQGRETLEKLQTMHGRQPRLIDSFKNWLIKYSDINLEEKANRKLSNKVIYSIDDENDYKLSVIEFISGMTDRFALNSFREITSFG